MSNKLLAPASLAAALLTAQSAMADDLENVDRLSQAQFKLLAGDLGSALSSKGLVASASLGLPGIDLGLSVGRSSINNRDVWQQAWGSGEVPDYLPISTWQAKVGLPFNVDLAGQYVVAHSTGLRLIGTVVRWGFIQEQLTVPALSLSVSYGRLIGADKLSFNTASVSVTASKNFRVVTPYVGLGQAWSQTEAVNVASLSPESTRQGRIFAGLQFNLLQGLTIQADRTGGRTSIGVNFGVHF